MLNNNGPRYKRSKLERKLNVDVIFCVILLFTMCLIGAVGQCLIMQLGKKKSRYLSMIDAFTVAGCLISFFKIMKPCWLWPRAQTRSVRVVGGDRGSCAPKNNFPL